LVCEEGIFEIKTINNLLVPQNRKTTLAQKPPTIPEKTRMYDTICHMINHTVESFKVKRKEDFVPIVFEVITQQIKVHRPMRYSCHICGDIRHKIIDCPKYKGMNTTNKQVVVEPKVSNPSVHMVDVNMAIVWSTVIEK